MKTTHTLHLLFFCCLFISSNLINAQCHIDDWTALKALYEATNGDKWYKNTGWEIVKNDEPPIDCDLVNLYGVSLGMNGRVVSLNLSKNELYGKIPIEIGKLKYLSELLLNDNFLAFGVFPVEIGNLEKLNILNINNIHLFGNIPSILGKLSNLSHLSLNGNELEGGIPPELGQLGNLKRLDLSDNYLVGKIPTQLGNLDNLESLDLGHNTLDSSIPKEFGNLSKLKYLGLDNNRLRGSIPNALGNLHILDSLYLNNNQLNGNIPFEIAQMSNLRIFNVSDNQLSGSIPPIPVYKEVIDFDFHLNYFTCNEISSLTNYVIADSPSWRLNPGPQKYRHNGMKSFIVDSLEFISLSAPFNNTGNFTYQWYFERRTQYKEEVIPIEGATDSILNLNNIQPKDVGFYTLHIKNTACIDIDDSFGISKEIEYISDPISVHRTDTSIPDCHINDWTALKALYESTDGDNWTINTGWEVIKEEGPPLDCHLDRLYGIDLYGRVQYLTLDNNNLSGVIPPELENLSEVIGIFLYDNKLKGSIPTELLNLHLLEVLIVSNNELSGSLPNLEGSTAGILLYSIESNYFLCNDLEGYIYNWDFLSISDDSYTYSPQKYRHSAKNSFILNSSTEAIILSAPFNRSGNFTYQWYIDERPIEDATDTILNLNIVQFEDVGNYTLHITDDSCNDSGVTFISDPISVRRTDLEGCTDTNSCNYNEFAFIDDGSCEYIWCDTMTNPIRIRTTNETILSETQIKFDILIDSLDLDYSADGLTFNLDTRGNYRIESIEVINPILSVTEVDISKLYKNTLSINRINSQRLASGEPILSAIACIIVEDVPTDETTCSHFIISGGTELASGHFIDFDNVYIDIPFSDCSPYGGYGAEGKNWLPLVLTITPQNCNTQTSGFAEIKILEDGQSPFTYIWKDELGTIILQATNEENPIKVPNLNAGNYELTVFDRSEKKTTMKTCIPLIGSLNGNENCNTNCVDYVTVPDGEIKGIHTAKKEIEIKGFVGKNETVEFNICE